MSAKKLSKVELSCLIISAKQGMHLLVQMTKHHKLERVRKARDNTLELATEDIRMAVGDWSIYSRTVSFNLSH